MFLVSLCITSDDLGFDKGRVHQDAVEGAWIVLHHSSNIIRSGDRSGYSPLGGGDRWLGSHEYGTENNQINAATKCIALGLDKM